MDPRKAPFLLYIQDSRAEISAPNGRIVRCNSFIVFLVDGTDAAHSDFLVDESTLPNVTFTLTRSFAGNIPVNRAGHPNDTLFFWAFEKANGSLTSTSSTDPWLIWLQGGYDCYYRLSFP